MKKAYGYCLVAIIALGIGIGGTCLILNKPNTKEKDIIEWEQTDKNQSTSIKKIPIEDIQNKILPLIKSTDQDGIYKKTKVNSKDIKDDNLILGATAFIVFNNDNEIKKDNSIYYITFDTINKYVKTLYGREIISNKLPESIAPIYSQSVLLNYNNKQKRYEFNLEFDTEASPIDAISTEVDDGIIYDRYEVKDDLVYIYEKKIINSNIDWSYTKSGTISKIDGNDTKEINNIENTQDLYKKFPEYFTEFRHTFRINSDETYTYITTEPAI